MWGFVCVSTIPPFVPVRKKNFFPRGFSQLSWVRKDLLAHSSSLISDSARGTVRITVLIRGKLGQDLN